MKNPLSISMESQGINLRALTPDDYPSMFELRTNASDLHLWKGSYRLPTKKEYYQDLDTLQRSHIDVFLVIAFETHAEPVGMAHTFDTNLIDGYTFGAIILAPEFKRQNIGTHATLLFLRYVFGLSPIRKVYADILEYNTASLSLVRKLGFVEEGCFRAHRYYKGEYWNSYRFAFYRENFHDIEYLLEG